MQVVCPKCKSRFNLPSGTKPGARLRCSVCMTVFSLPFEESSDYARQSSLSSGTLPPLGASDVPQSVLPQLEEKKAHHPFLWFLVVVLVLGIAGYAAWEISGDFRGAVINLKNNFIPAQAPVKPVLQPEMGVRKDEASPVIPRQQIMENATRLAEPEEIQHSSATNEVAQVSSQVQDSDKILPSSLRLEKVRQYFVDNEKIGRILVIEGSVCSQESFKTSEFTVEAMIIGEDKKIIEKKINRIGGHLSTLQLQKMDREEIEVAMYADMDDNVIKNEVPFMALFFNPAERTSEFSVRIVSKK